MKLHYLWIGQFKNLHNLEITFGEESLFTVLIGHNGTGKSNVVEALVLIFRDLDLGHKPPFAYKIRYERSGRQIRVDADPDCRPRHTLIHVDGEYLSFTRFIKDSQRDLLPSHVFGYYSGSSNRLEGYFDIHQRKFYDQLIRSESDAAVLPMRPLFYARAVHSQFVLLAYFLDTERAAHAFLREYFRITGIESVLFVMREPDWARSRHERQDSRAFWGAAGVVRGFLEHLRVVALAPLHVRVGPTDDRLYLFVKDIQALQDLYSQYGSLADFFKVLESTYISELMLEIRIRVHTQDSDEPLTFIELSEGEQQLLTVLGLLRFTRDAESLFLLDEPDTHLNPAWSLHYLDLLDRVVGASEASHVILATHDPLVIAGLTRHQVQILHRDIDAGPITANQPTEDPRGMGVAALLTSELFGLRSTLDLQTLGLLDEQRRLAVMADRSHVEDARLAELNSHLGNLDFTRSVRDPLYSLFVEAMYASDRYRELQQPVLTPEEQEAQRQLALQVLDEIDKVEEPEIH